MAFVLRSILPDMSIATPDFLSFQFAWNIFFYPLTFSLPMQEVSSIYNADTPCTVGRERMLKGREKNLFKLFLSCHKIWILFHNFPLLIINCSIESSRWSNVWSLNVRVGSIMSLHAGPNSPVLSFWGSYTSRMLSKEWHATLGCPIRLKPVSLVCALYMSIIL